MMKRLILPSFRASQGHFAKSGKLSACLAALALCGVSKAAVTLNEVDSSTVQFAPTTEGFQFVELKGAPGESLNGYTLVFFNGSNDSVYRVISLDGFAIGASGYFVAGNPGVPKVDLVLPTVQASSVSNNPPDDDSIQPGPDAVALYHNASNAYVPGSFVTAGAPPNPKSVAQVNAAPGETRVDALLYASFTVADDVDLKSALGVTEQFNENANGNRLTESLSRNGANWIAVPPSPGRDNFLAFPAGGKLLVDISDPDLTVAEGGSPVLARVKLQDAAGAPLLAPAGGLAVTVYTTDFSEAALAPGPVFIPGTETSTRVALIPAGSSQSSDFLLIPQNDVWQDGNQTAFIVAEPPDGVTDVVSHSSWLTVADNDGGFSSAVINEVNGYIPSGINARPGVDANGDGAVDAADRFVEIVNPGAAALDLSGFQLATDETIVTAFPACTFLLPGQALIVFGGGPLTEGITASFSNAIIRKATGGLNIHNGTAVRLLDSLGREAAGHVFGATENGSNTRKLDTTGKLDARYGNSWLQVPAEGPGTYDAPFFFGTAPAGNAGYRFDAARPYSTPGTAGNGTTPFVSVPLTLGLTFTDTFSNTANAASVPELWGKGAAKLTFTRTAAPPDSGDLCVRIVRSNSNAASTPPTLTTDAAGLLPDVGDSITIPAAVLSFDLFLHTTDTTPGNGDNTFTVSVFSSAYQNSAKSILIRDSDASLLSFKCDSIVESAGAGASSLKISGGVGTSAYLVRSETVGANPLGAQVPPASATGSLAAGAATLPIDALNDVPVANRQVRFTYLSGPAGDSRNSTRLLNVVDDGGVIELGPFINEADTAQALPDHSDYVELTSPSASSKSLNGFVFVVYGPAGTVVSNFNLSGSTFRAGNDFFVLWNETASGPGRLNTGSSDWLPASGALAVYRGAPADYPVGSPATCNNLIDALVFNAANAGLQDMLAPGSSAVSETASYCVLARTPDATLITQLRNSASYAGTSSHRTPGYFNGDVFSGYNAYADRFPATAPAIQGPLNDTDGDGLQNLFEYFLGTDPTAFNSLPLPVIAAGTATLTIDRGFDSLCDPHVALTAESSTDLLLWTPMTAAGTDPIQFTAPAPGPKFFTRLKVTVVP